MIPFISQLTLLDLLVSVRAINTKEYKIESYLLLHLQNGPHYKPAHVWCSYLMQFTSFLNKSPYDDLIEL